MNGKNGTVWYRFSRSLSASCFCLMKIKPAVTQKERPPTPRGALRLHRLQSAATEMFLHHGFEGVSLDLLIREAGGSRRNIYGPCGGKQGLFVAAMGELVGEIAAQIEALPMADVDLQEGLGRYGRKLLELLLQPRLLAMHRLMVAEAQRFPELSQAMRENGPKRATASLAAWLRPFQDAGALRTDLPAPRLAEQYIDLIVSSPQMRALVGELPPGWTPAGIHGHVEASIEVFLHGGATGGLAGSAQTTAAAPAPARSRSPASARRIKP